MCIFLSLTVLSVSRLGVDVGDTVLMVEARESTEDILVHTVMETWGCINEVLLASKSVDNPLVVQDVLAAEGVLGTN